MPELSVTVTDIIVLVVYVLGTRLAFGYYISRRAAADSESYFLAGRRLAWPIIGFSFYVSNMSGSTFVGLPGSGYNDGVAVYNYEWLPAVILVFFSVFVLPAFLRARVFTTPGFLERRYDARSKLAFSGFLLCANIFIDAAAALYAGGMILKVLFPGVPLWLTAIVISLIAGVYIVVGGLDAVVLNDVVQAAVILVGGVVIAVLTWAKIPSWEAVSTTTSQGSLHLIRSVSDPTMPWPGIITGVFVVGLYFWCTNQFMVQRALGARSLDHARWGALFAGALKLPNLFILVLPGVMATTLYPSLERPDMVFPALAFDLLPVGLRGVILAALAAAILSSLESIFNSASTLFTMDFVRHCKPGVADRTLVVIGRWATLAFMTAAALWAPTIERFPTLWQYLQSILSYVTPPVVVVFLAGLFFKRASATAAFLTLCSGIPLGIVGWTAVEILKLCSVQYLYASGIMFALSCLLMLVLSVGRAPAENPDLDSLMWRPCLWRAERTQLRETPWYANYRLLSVALIVVTAIVVIWWW